MLQCSVELALSPAPATPTALSYFMHPAYRPEIDGLRALAVVSVLVFHLKATWLPGGFIGVDIFFVISGFLITGIINKEVARGEFSFSAFYARRAKRIFPALFTVLILSSLFAYISLPPDEYKAFFKALRYVLLQLGNVHFAQDVDYFNQGLFPSALLHTWSLGVEEQFYLLWPLLIVLCYKWLKPSSLPALFVLALISSLCLSQLLLTIDAKQAYYMVYSRAWELLLGGLLAFGKLPEVNSQKAADIASSLALMVMIFCLFSYEESSFPGVKALPPVAAAALYIHSANRYKGFGHRLLTNKVSLAIGLCSYSLYLWHWPLITFTKTITEEPLSSTSIVSLSITCLVLSALSYQYVERPFLKLKIHKRSVITLSLTCILIGVLASNLLKTLDRHPSRSDYSYDMNENAAIDIEALCRGKYQQTCTARADGNYDVLLAGDSHGEHYAPLILSWAQARNYTVKTITLGGCPTWLKQGANLLEKDSSTCRALKKELSQSLGLITGPVFVALKADQLPIAYGVHSAAALADIITPELKQRSVTLLLQVPLLNKNPNSCEFKQNSRFSAWIKILYTNEKSCLNEISNKQMFTSNTLLKQLANTLSWRNYTPEPLNEHFFNAEGKFLYKDEHHLNIYGNDYLAAHFKESIAAPSVQTSRIPAPKD